MSHGLAEGTATSTSVLPLDLLPSRGRWLSVLSHIDPRYGGLSTAVPRLGLSLAKLGYTVSLAAFCAPTERFRPDGYAETEVSFWPSGRRPWLSREPYRRFRELVMAANGVHVHGLWEMSTMVACRQAHGLGKPYILSAHGMLEPWALQQKALKKKLYAAALERAHVQKAACLHALTRDEAEQYRGFGADGPIAVVPNAVQVPEERSPEPFLEAFPTLRGRRLVLFLGRLHPKKGLDLLAEAWHDLAGQHPDGVLVLAGPDSEGTESRLRAALSAEVDRGQVLFTGMLTGAMKWSALAAAECFVLPSFSEGLSMSVLEAMGSGVPVLVTDACHMPEVGQRRAGWEITAEKGPLYDALNKMLRQTPEANRAVGARGAALVAERYSAETVARQMAEVYDFVLNGRQPATVELLQRETR